MIQGVTKANWKGIGYQGIADSYEALYGSEQRKKLRIIKQYLKIKKVDKLLDVGCGTGVSSNFNCEVIGLDKNLNLLKKFKCKKNQQKIHGFAERLPFKDNTFDYVLSLTAIHNFDDFVKALAEMKRVGKVRYFLSILKKSRNFEKIIEMVRTIFIVKKEIDEGRDIIVICE